MFENDMMVVEGDGKAVVMNNNRPDQFMEGSLFHVILTPAMSLAFFGADAGGRPSRTNLIFVYAMVSHWLHRVYSTLTTSPRPLHLSPRCLGWPPISFSA